MATGARTLLTFEEFEKYQNDGKKHELLNIEVASESNTAAQLDLKIELYFAYRAEEVWIVYPQTRRVRAHFADGHSETLAAAGLRSVLFPGRSAPLDSIFPE